MLSSGGISSPYTPALWRRRSLGGGDGSRQILALTIDRSGKLWRVIMPHYQLPPRDESTPERSMETSVPRWRGSIALDLKSNTTTLARAKSETEFPTMKEREIERTFALSRLTEGR